VLRAIARIRTPLHRRHPPALHCRDVLLPLRAQVLLETQLLYNAMQIGPMDLLRTKEQQIEAAVRYIDALREYWMARADLDIEAREMIHAKGVNTVVLILRVA
jgi:hypothetical protein